MLHKEKFPSSSELSTSKVENFSNLASTSAHPTWPAGAIFHAASRTVAVSIFDLAGNAPVQIDLNSSAATALSVRMRLGRMVTLQIALSRAVEHLKSQGLVTDDYLAKPRFIDEE